MTEYSDSYEIEPTDALYVMLTQQIDHFVREWDMDYAQIVGTLEAMKHKYLHEITEVEDE